MQHCFPHFGVPGFSAEQGNRKYYKSALLYSVLLSQNKLPWSLACCQKAPVLFTLLTVCCFAQTETLSHVDKFKHKCVKLIIVKRNTLCTETLKYR